MAQASNAYLIKLKDVLTPEQLNNDFHYMDHKQ